MLSTAEFLSLTKWSGIATGVFAVLMLLGFALQWGIRFRLVGTTGFMAVLTAGLFALSVVPIMPTVVPGAIKFSTVYDGGANQAVIVVPASVTEPELTATLKQAASNLFSPGRLGRGTDQLTIRARTVLHPEPGISQPLVLGEVQRSLRVRNDENITVTIFDEALALAHQAAEVTP